MSNIEFGLQIRMNIAYHSARYAFLKSWVRFEKIVLLASLTTTIALVKSNIDPVWVYSFIGLASLMTITLIATGADESMNEHHSIYKRLVKLSSDFEIEYSNSAAFDAGKIQKEFNEIVADQPPAPNTALLIFCQNQVLREAGENYRIKQSWYARLFRNIVDFDADSLNPEYVDVLPYKSGSLLQKIAP